MANNITGNPIFINATGVLFAQRFKFDGGIWNSAASGNVFTLVDNTGRTVFSAVYPTSLDPVEIPKMGWLNGLTCTVMGGGNATIYVGLK
jgi:hypothetical protein